MKPNPNLWAVKAKYATDPNHTEHLWILAANAGTAERKAMRFLRKRGEKGIRIESVKHEGTIDAF